MDDFIEEHSQCYEFRDRQAPAPPQQPAPRRPHPPGSAGSGSGQEEDRYVAIFQALQKELCRMSCPPMDRKVTTSRPRTLRVLQCLRLLTRDSELQLAFFEGGGGSAAAALRGHRGERPERGHGGAQLGERCRERDRDLDRTGPAPPRERGRVAPPATSSRAAPHPPPASNSRLGVSASPRRANWRGALHEAVSAAAAGYGGGGATAAAAPSSGSGPRRCRSVGTGEEFLHAGGTAASAVAREPPPSAREVPESEREYGVRLPPLDARAGPVLAEAGEATPATSALLRLLAELVAEYLAEVEDGDLHTHAADACAGAGRDARLGIAVAGLCIAEIVGMLNRYASTEARRSRLAQLGTLRPLARLLSGVSDPLVLRCALEALAHLTRQNNPAVLAELAQLSPAGGQREFCVPQALRGCPAGGSCPTGVLRECLHLLDCGEEMYEGLAAQLLDQLLEAPELRSQLRRLQGLGTVVAHLSAGAAELQRPSGTAESEAPARLSGQAKRAVHMLRCVQKLARDHVGRGDATAVHELLKQGALEAMLPLLRHHQPSSRDSSGQARNGELVLACLDTLAQMCMDDECATALRLQHVEGFATLGALLLGDARRRPSRTEAHRAASSGSLPVQCAAARLLRFLFSVERNRRALKHIFPMGVLELFIDVGSYVWALEAYEPFVRAVNALSEREAALLRSNFHRQSERSSTKERWDAVRKPSNEGLGDLGVASPLPSEPSTPSRNTVCGYELIECVGSGAFGKVHLARRLDRPGDFALKEVPLNALSEPLAWPDGAAAGPRRDGRCGTPREGQEDRFGEGCLAQAQVAEDISQEVRLLRQLDHPNIVQYYASFTTSSGVGSTLWIVMEFCGGASLQAFTASAREKGLAKLPEEQTWQIFVQLCLALRYLHVEKGIAHRDLTPNNVLVQSHTLAVKLADFGLARQKAGAGIAGASMMKSMVGTILYSCPEIVQQRPYTHKTDVWALGCLLYKMASLRDPFQGNNPLSVARRIVECEYERLDEALHSEMLVRTCSACLTVSSEERPDIEQVCQMITPALVRHLETVQRVALASRQQQETPASRGGSSPATSPTRRSGVSERAAPLPRRLMRTSTLSPAPEENTSPSLGPLAKTLFEEPPPLSPLAALSRPTLCAKREVPQPPPLAPDEHFPNPPGKAQAHGAKRVPRAAADPVAKALTVAHRLAFVGQLPPLAHGQEDTRRIALDRYQRWLFGSPHNASLVKREVSRLSQRLQEPVECLALSGESPSMPSGAEEEQPESGASSPVLPQLTYERLYGYLLEVCAEHGYGGAHIPRAGADSESG